MDALCLDVLNSDWHDYRHAGKGDDRLLKSAWVEQLIAQWGLAVSNPPDEETIVALQSLRSLMQCMVQALLQNQALTGQDMAELNSYLNAAPSQILLVREDERYELQQVPLHNDWRWVLRKVALSFATLLTQHDPTRIKLCENPDCRWVYYDESPYHNRRWCEDTCANLMRVRQFRARHKKSSTQTSL
ncbi:MAG TPA: CGNR zinc finger domain-containing protein [Ktedonobacteraceae bacterium]|nr:CGNR zinc finger domain-containing protein [Ktedonobacteraceae bacterium]